MGVCAAASARTRRDRCRARRHRGRLMNHTVVFDRVGNGYTVRFPYDALLVELLKSRVPSYARTWFSAGKQWTVDADWYQPLAAAMRAVGCTVVGLDAPRQQAHDGKDWARALFTAVGP